MSTRVMNVAIGANADVTLFPNGGVFSTNDVFLGGCYLEWFQIAIPVGAPTVLSGTLTVYDGTVASSQRNVIGGVTNDAPADMWRVNAGQTVLLTNQGEPYITAGAPSADITGQRKVIDGLPIYLPPAADQPSMLIPVHHLVRGCSARITGGIAGTTVSIGYIPHASGYARRRRIYRPGCYGVSSAAAANSLTDASQAWIPDQWKGYFVMSNAKLATVLSNTATVLTIDTWIGGTPTAVRNYAIYTAKSIRVGL